MTARWSWPRSTSGSWAAAWGRSSARSSLAPRSTRSRGLQRLRELILSELPEGSRAQVYVLHTNAPADASDLGEWARRTFHCVEYQEQDAGPVLATHVGPGVVAMGFFRED